jgi:hypothetical protein
MIKLNVKEIINLFNVKKDEDSIHLRAVRWGFKKPNGFGYTEIEKHYSKREQEWEVVKVFLMNARRNKDASTNLNTPYMVLKTTGSGDNEATFTLNYDAYFNYLDYLELVMAQRNARSAFWTAIIAIFISIVATGISIYYSQKQIESPVKMEAGQYHQLIETIEK